MDVGQFIEYKDHAFFFDELCEVVKERVPVVERVVL